MPRALLALVLGAVAGATITYFTFAARVTHILDAGVAASPLATGAAPVEARTRPDSAQSVTAERAALYRTAADADGAGLARMIAQTAARAPSRARDEELGVLLARYAELDGERAVAIARKLGVNVETLAMLFARWAETDPTDALAALGDVEDPATATAIGLALLPVLGDDDYALRQVLTALPRAADDGLRVGALAKRAERDPVAALDDALALDDFGTSSFAIERIGATWARTDPRAALEGAAAIDDNELRTPFQNAVLRAWALVDAQGLLDYVAALAPEAQGQLSTVGLFEVARLDPERTLALIDRFSSGVRGELERVAVEALARADPEGALERVRKLPPGRLQQNALQSLARAYGKRNPDAALAWAQAEADREAMVGVLTGIATRDPKRALDVAATLPKQDRASAVIGIVMLGAGNNRDADLAGLAERLLSVDDEFANTTGLAQLLGTWQRRAPERAVEWVMANAARLPPAAFGSVGSYLAQNDPAAAERLLAQVPSEGRTAWLQGMAGSYAQSDVKAGLAWVERLRGDPAYPAAASAIAQGLARSDPPAAAALLDSIADRGSIPGPSMAIASSNVASSWARTNPLAAAEWARGFATDERSMQPLSTIAQIWGASDYGAARAWTLRLPAGTSRDAALRPLLTAGGNGIDTSLLASFSGELPRQRAVLTAVQQLARRNPSEARALIDRYVTAPELREQANRILVGPGVIGPF
ncbi:MAG TPA: hypothetical protein VE907_10790 [Gammaproteobacteria bacterium]|nr:hypothetical protein [Gammaproteobacteria bacterium]